MRLTVNGKTHIHKGNVALPALLRKLKVNGDRVAIMVNDAVIAKGDRISVRLKSGDRIELLVFAGGG